MSLQIAFALTVLCVAANAFIALADYRRARFVSANAALVGVPPTAVPYLATLKLAGALGLAAGLLGAPRLGLAAGAGLTAFFLGALITHVRARVLHNIAFPGVYLLLAIAATVYFAS
ncbi:DoxX family protein [Streptomyces sp. SUK 48]|uniref:DoxX family protein n=1 Tax=Streptomyces sp. SUK 48 TaxID=2582831 RepID=UPI00129B4FB0|nr:DoxX family protein [Streptomyces sp. SUK 48]